MEIIDIELTAVESLFYCLGSASVGSLDAFYKPHAVLIKVMRFCHVKSTLVPENPFGRCSP